MRRKLVVGTLLLGLAVASVASAQLVALATTGGLAFLTASGVKLKTPIKKVEVPLAEAEFQGALIGVVGGLVVLDIQGIIDTGEIVGPPKAAVKNLEIELLRVNANGSKTSLGKVSPKWNKIEIPGVDQGDLGLPDNLPLAVGGFVAAAPPAGAHFMLVFTAKGGSSIPANMAVALGGAGADVSSLSDPAAASGLLNQFLANAEGLTGLHQPIARARPTTVLER